MVGIQFCMPSMFQALSTRYTNKYIYIYINQKMKKNINSYLSGVCHMPKLSL